MAAHQAPLSLGFSRQEHWSGLPCPPAGDLPHPGIKPEFLTTSAWAGGFFSTKATWEAPSLTWVALNTNCVMRWHQPGYCQHSHCAYDKWISNSVNDIYAIFSFFPSFPPRSLPPFCLQLPSYLTTPTCLQIWLWVFSRSFCVVGCCHYRHAWTS